MNSMPIAADRVDRESPLPLYHQLREILRHQIASGSLRPGDQLPPEAALGQIYGLSRITVRQALMDLSDEGYIRRGRGQGTFVAEPKVEDRRVNRLGGFMEALRDQGYEATAQVIDSERQPCSHKVASLLRLAEGDPVIRFRRLVFAGEETIMLATSYLVAPESVVISVDDLERFPSTYPYLANKHGIALVRGDRTLEATLADDEEAGYLQIERGDPVLLAETIVYDRDDVPRMLVKAIYRGDRYKYHLHLTI